MIEIFNFLGGILGYILWGSFLLVKNFGIAIIIFTIIIKLLVFPFSIKQQKSMAANARMQQKQREIMQKYANNRQKQSEELALLMEKEGASPYSGCLNSFLPLLIMMCVYYSVINPLTNTLHIAGDKVATALNTLGTLPGIGSGFNTYYGQIYIVEYFDKLKDFFVNPDGSQLFTGAETQSIADFSHGFNFLGLNLLATPASSDFSSMLWLIPVLCFISYIASSLLMQKMNGTAMSGPGAGCMKVMIFAMPLFSAYIAYTVPAAVGFYWICSTIFGFLQSIILNKFYNARIMEAKAEARRVVLRVQEEANVPFGNYESKAAPVQTNVKKNNGSNNNKKSGKQNNAKKKNNSSSSDYQGRKK